MTPLKPLITAATLLLLAACTKSTSGSSSSATQTDTLSLITSHRWVLYQDSIATNNFAFPDGEVPGPGVIWGNQTDYWNFKTDNTFTGMVMGITLPETKYQLLTSNKLYINSSPDQGLASISTLNANAFIFVFKDTSTIGGTYYQRVWLKK